MSCRRAARRKPFLHSAPLLARCAAIFARLPQTAILHQRRAWAFVSTCFPGRRWQTQFGPAYPHADL